MWKLIPTKILIKKYDNEAHALYKPAAKSLLNNKWAVSNYHLLEVVKQTTLSVRATHSSTEAAWSYYKANLCRIYLKSDWLGKSIDITTHELLTQIMSSTHVIINQHGKIKKTVNKL